MGEHQNTLTQNSVEKRFNLYVLIFRTTGIPIFYKNVSNILKLYNAIALFSCYTTHLTILLDVFMHLDDLELTMETARGAFPSAMNTFVYIFLRFRTSDVEKLLRHTESFTWEEDLPKRESEDGTSTMIGWIPRIQKIIRPTISVLFIFHWTYSIIRIFTSNDRTLTLNAWYPFNTMVSPIYELVNLSQIIAAAIYTCMHFGFMGMYASLVIVACIQLKILKSSLLSIKWENISYQNLNTETGQKFGKPISTSKKEICHTQLNECIRHHTEILRYMRCLEETLNPIMAVIFLLLLISLCFSAFSIVTSWGNYAQMAQGIVTYVLLILVLAVYCWFGEELANQADSVRDAAWGCDWIGMPIPFQRYISLIITSANNEFTLTAGKFVPVTIRTMVNMINDSYSYFMFLIQFKDNVENTNNNG